MALKIKTTAFCNGFYRPALDGAVIPTAKQITIWQHQHRSHILLVGGYGGQGRTFLAPSLQAAVNPSAQELTIGQHRKGRNLARAHPAPGR